MTFQVLHMHGVCSLGHDRKSRIYTLLLYILHTYVEIHLNVIYRNVLYSLHRKGNIYNVKHTYVFLTGFVRLWETVMYQLSATFWVKNIISKHMHSVWNMPPLPPLLWQLWPGYWHMRPPSFIRIWPQKSQVPISGARVLGFGKTLLEPCNVLFVLLSSFTG